MFIIRTWVSKDDHTSDLGGHVRGQYLGRVVDELAALAVPGHDDLGVRAAGDGLLREIGHELGAIRIAAGQEACHVGRVVNALDGQVPLADGVGHGLEEGRPRDGTDVARLGGAPGEDDDILSAAAVLEAVLVDT